MKGHSPRSVICNTELNNIITRLLTLEFETDLIWRNHNFESYSDFILFRSGWSFNWSKTVKSFCLIALRCYSAIFKVVDKFRSQPSAQTVWLCFRVFELKNDWKCSFCGKSLQTKLYYVYYNTSIFLEPFYSIFHNWQHSRFPIRSAQPSRTFRTLLSSTLISQIFLRLLSTGMYAKFMILFSPNIYFQFESYCWLYIPCIVDYCFLSC